MNQTIERLATEVMDSDHPGVAEQHRQAALLQPAERRTARLWAIEEQARHLLAAVHTHARVTDITLSAPLALAVAARIAERVAALELGETT